MASVREQGHSPSTPSCPSDCHGCLQPQPSNQEDLRRQPSHLRAVVTEG
ncbi:rCG47009 [Rattus norvegicus]|uniref:RCG47009 n=1 Tax=Rattus norvegicus TaxID=10116 RepID=A6K4W0_RAT|nr:rCG47009 [Rattus norvegicus]